MGMGTVDPLQLAAAAATAPAGGAPFSDVLVVSLASAAVSLTVLAIGHRVRSGRARWTIALADGLAARSGLARWAALPLLVMLLGVVAAGLGMAADISWHVARGRDLGALGNPTHYPILIGLYIWLLGAWLGFALADDRVGPAALRVTSRIRAPLGAVVSLAGVAAAMLSFPLDDAWHRLFGQDVTFWGPTHLVLVGSGTVAVIGMGLLAFEGRRAGQAARGPGAREPLGARVAGLIFCTALVAAPSVYLLEWHFGIPQAALLFDPAVTVLTTGSLVVARLMLGRGGALAAAVLALAVTFAVTAVVGPLLDLVTPRFGLLLPGAAMVELAALAAGTRKLGRFAVLAGALAGSIGLLGERLWTSAWRPLEWPSDLLAETLAVGVAIAIAAALLGAFFARAIDRDRSLRVSTRPIATAAGATTVIVGIFAFLATSGPPQGSAEVRLAETADGGEAYVSARFASDSLPDDADWLNVSSWQGGDLVIEPLVERPSGLWRTAGPVPIAGEWKTGLRWAEDGGRAAIPIWLPADRGIPAPQLRAPEGVSAEFVAEAEFLQRERRLDTPAWLWAAAMAGVMALWALLVALLAWALVRYAADGEPLSFARRARRRTPSWLGSVAGR